MKIIQLYGLRRSGTHAIINWFKTNFELEYGVSKVGFLNDAIELRDKFYPQFEWSKKNLEFLIISYEDASLETSLISEEYLKVVLIRDIFNLSASRIKRGTDDMKVDENFLELWLEYSNFEGVFKYEDFLINKDKRDSLCHHLNVKNHDFTNGVMAHGGGSSFVGRKLDTKENYLNRYSMVEFNDKINKLLSDSRIEKARKKLGYLVS